jgi:hypothetical protein
MARCKVDDFVVEKSRYSRLASSYGERIIAWILLRNSEDRGEKNVACAMSLIQSPEAGAEHGGPCAAATGLETSAGFIELLVLLQADHTTMPS